MVKNYINNSSFTQILTSNSIYPIIRKNNMSNEFSTYIDKSIKTAGKSLKLGLPFAAAIGAANNPDINFAQDLQRALSFDTPSVANAIGERCPTGVRVNNNRSVAVPFKVYKSGSNELLFDGTAQAKQVVEKLLPDETSNKTLNNKPAFEAFMVVAGDKTPAIQAGICGVQGPVLDINDAVKTAPQAEKPSQVPQEPKASEPPTYERPSEVVYRLDPAVERFFRGVLRPITSMGPERFIGWSFIAGFGFYLAANFARRTSFRAALALGAGTVYAVQAITRVL